LKTKSKERLEGEDKIEYLSPQRKNLSELKLIGGDLSTMWLR
tara:strand:+ start:249 stop:374 length:126 start_codon:yes stop_codon:yes gene_type:complete